MELEKIEQIEKATWVNRREVFRLGMALLFIVGIMLYVSSIGEVSVMLVVAGVIGGYMALNIGANDVANNVGPAVGSRALTLTGAIAIAAVFEASGALIAGGDVVSTIKKGIIDPGAINDPEMFIWLMMAALLAGALWLNIATAVGAPVSTTHSIVGGVLGAGAGARRPARTPGRSCRAGARHGLRGRRPRRRYRGGFSVFDQAHHHLSIRYAAGGETNGADTGRDYGAGLCHLPGTQRP